MKKFYLVVALICLTQVINAQTLLAKWSIPTGQPADSFADGGIAGNISVKVLKSFGTSTIDWSKNGYAGKAAQATQWDNGNGLKYWQIEVMTTGYNNIKISSRQQSGNANPSPRDFKLQYRIGSGGTWTDAPGGNIKVLNNWDTSYVNNLILPTACNNSASVFIRWIMTSNTAIDGSSTVVAPGTSKIDDIMIYGDVISGVESYSENTFNFYPNPVASGSQIRLSSTSFVNSIEIIDITGKSVLMNNISTFGNDITLDISKLRPGMYFIKLSSEGKTSGKKIIIY